MADEEKSKEEQGSNPLFDHVPERRGTHSLKWDKYGDRDIIPMWVADMDFRSPPEVIEAAEQAVALGNFGYGKPSPGLVEIVVDRLKELHDWEIDPRWIIWLPGMVCAFNVALRACGQPGDDVLTAVPVYPPFLTAPGNFGQNLVQAPLALEDGRWSLDFDALEEAVTDRTRNLLLCHPHNPVGTVFTRKELERLADFCLRHDIVACSDEIHCEMILDEDCSHYPLASISPQIADRTITLMAPSKTFNLPGFGCSFAIISNNDLRTRYKKARADIVPDPPAMGLTLAEAAYRHGEPWRRELLAYLRANRDFALERLSSMPGLQPFHNAATYLTWIDARELEVEDACSFFEEHGVGLSDGRAFGTPGYLRLNLGCARSLLSDGLDRMAAAIA
ncbi:MAG: PatB family C-S lyase, partial [Opitutales bacterium]